MLNKIIMLSSLSLVLSSLPHSAYSMDQEFNNDDNKISSFFKNDFLQDLLEKNESSSNNINEIISQNITEEKSSNYSIFQKKEESIDKYPGNTENVVRYTTRAMGRTMNQYFDFLGQENEEYLKFSTTVQTIINQKLEEPFSFYIQGCSHDYFLRTAHISLDKEGATSLKGTNFTFMDLAKGLLNTDISLKNNKARDLREDTVVITLKKMSL